VTATAGGVPQEHSTGVDLELLARGDYKTHIYISSLSFLRNDV